jgi:hypothetical protein
MKPMAPMKPMDSDHAWWPKKLGSPASSGGQDDMHYAFFPDHHCLAIQENGQVTLYDSANHQISGVSQQQGSDQTLTFQSQGGEIQVSELMQVR